MLEKYMKNDLEKLSDKDLRSKINEAYSMLEEEIDDNVGKYMSASNTPLASVINVFNTELNNRSSKRFAFWSTLLIITSILVQIISLICD